MQNPNITTKPQTDQLFILIKSLNKSEKRNFKLYAKRTQANSKIKFIQLFDIIDKSKKYDEAAIREKMSSNKKTQFANLKSNLYKQILTSLRLVHISKNIDIEIRQQIDFARILYGKGLFLQSLRLLERIKIVADENHQDLLLLEILEFQKFIEERHITRSRTIKGKVEKLTTDAEKRSNVILNTCKLTNLKIEIHGHYIQYGHVKNKADADKFKHYYFSKLKETNLQNLTFFEKVFLYQSYVWYYYILLDFNNCFKYAKKWVSIFNKNKMMIDEDPNLYMRGLHYILTSLFNLRNHATFTTYIQLFNQFTTQYDKQLNENSKTIAFLYLSTAEINLHFLEGTFAKGLQLVPNIKRDLVLFEKHLDPHRIMVFNYKIAYLYFGNGDYNKSIDYLNKIINEKMGHLREDIQCYSRLLQLIAHFELGHYVLLDSLVDSVQRFLSKMKEYNLLQNKTITFFRNIIKRVPSEHILLFKSFSIELEELAKDPFEKRAFIYLDTQSWVQSKLENKNLSEILRDRFRLE